MPCRKLNITDFFIFHETKQASEIDLCFPQKKINAHYEYSPFGKITKTSGTLANDFDFRFSSEVYDIETGLVYYNYRYYSPELGRWLSRDPINEAGGVNLYAMVGNGVVNKRDMLGNGEDPSQLITDGLDLISFSKSLPTGCSVESGDCVCCCVTVKLFINQTDGVDSYKRYVRSYSFVEHGICKDKKDYNYHNYYFDLRVGEDGYDIDLQLVKCCCEDE